MQDVFIYLSVLIIGVIVGLLVAKFAFASSEDTASVAEKEQATAMTHAQLREQLNAASASMGEIDKQIASFKEQLTEIDYILTSHEQGENQPRITFFGDHASPYINTNQKEPREQSPSEHQPRDFSNSSSGLFAGENKTADK